MKLLAYFCLLTLCLPPLTEDTKSGQSNRVSRKDSVQLAKYTRQLEKSYRAEYDEMTDQDWVLLKNSARLVFNGSVHYSPDSSFKIFAFAVSSCGYTCSYDWYSWLHYNLRTQEIVKKFDACGVDSIVKLDQSRYLVFQSWFSRETSARGLECIQLRYLSFNGPSFRFLEIPFQGTKTISFCEENGGSEDYPQFLSYDKVLKTLNYRFTTTSYFDKYEIDSVRWGHYRFENSGFNLMNEKVETFVRRYED